VAATDAFPYSLVLERGADGPALSPGPRRAVISGLQGPNRCRLRAVCTEHPPAAWTCSRMMS